MSLRDQTVPVPGGREASSTDPCFALRVTFCDSVNNGFVSLGGAGFDSESEWQAHWNSVPGADRGYDDPDKLTLDKLDQQGDIVDERPISRAVAESLLGDSLDVLIEQGRARTCFTYGQYKAAQEAAVSIHH